MINCVYANKKNILKKYAFVFKFLNKNSFFRVYTWEHLIILIKIMTYFFVYLFTYGKSGGYHG